MPDRANFETTFARLKRILQEFEPNLVVQSDEPGNYYLNTPFSEQYKQEVFFGAVQIKKNYVSFHLMPVYMFPDLLEGISAPLRKRMQGKSCFNFTSPGEDMLDELAALTQKSVKRVRREKLL